MKKVIQGLIIGIANAVPGISGATLALILGCYDDLIELMSSPFCLKNIFKHRWMLIGLVLGIFIAIFLLSFLYERIPLLITCYFLGLIIGGIPKMVRDLPHFSFFNCIIFIIAIFFIIYIQSLSKRQLSLEISLGITILAAGISGLAMILPGVSGTLMLMALGVYFPLLSLGKVFLSNLFQFNFSFDYNIFIIISFTIFLIISLVIFSKVLKIINRLRPKSFIYFSLGLVIGSIIVVFIQLINAYQLWINCFELLTGIILGILSIVLVIKKAG